MSNFTDKAFSKLSKLSPEEIRRFFENQMEDLSVRNSLLDSISDGYIAINPQNKVVYCNQVVFDLINVNKEKKYYGLKLESFIKEHEILAFMTESVKKGDKSAEAEFQITSSLNGQRNIRVSCLNTKKSDNVVFCIQDVTFFKKIKEEFKKNESLAAMTTMAAGVAHEIKNPLASISIYLQMLEMKLEKEGSITYENAKKSLTVIRDEVDRINRIAVDFNFAVKPVNAVMVPISINDVVDKTIDLIEAELSEKNIEYKLNLQTSLPKIKADGNLVEQALLNLLKNAIQAIGNKEGMLTVSTYVDDDMVKVDVTDNGCGMTDSQKNRIFEPYFTTKETGTGLGLTLLFKIMKEHDGDVAVASQENVGTTFTLMFPIPQSERFRIER